jgi:hypothetical protein
MKYAKALEKSYIIHYVYLYVRALPIRTCYDPTLESLS